MKAISQTICIFLIVVFIGAAGEDGHCRQAIWVSGRVEKAPWSMDGNDYLIVNQTVYKILPEIPIRRRVLRDKGAYDEKKARRYSIHKGQEIMLNVIKKDVIQILLFD